MHVHNTYVCIQQITYVYLSVVSSVWAVCFWWGGLIEWMSILNYASERASSQAISHKRPPQISGQIFGHFFMTMMEILAVEIMSRNLAGWLAG